MLWLRSRKVMQICLMCNRIWVKIPNSKPKNLIWEILCDGHTRFRFEYGHCYWRTVLLYSYKYDFSLTMKLFGKK